MQLVVTSIAFASLALLGVEKQGQYNVTSNVTTTRPCLFKINVYFQIVMRFFTLKLKSKTHENI